MTRSLFAVNQRIPFLFVLLAQVETVKIHWPYNLTFNYRFGDQSNRFVNLIFMRKDVSFAGKTLLSLKRFSYSQCFKRASCKLECAYVHPFFHHTEWNIFWIFAHGQGYKSSGEKAIPSYCFENLCSLFLQNKTFLLRFSKLFSDSSSHYATYLAHPHGNCFTFDHCRN